MPPCPSACPEPRGTPCPPRPPARSPVLRRPTARPKCPTSAREPHTPCADPSPTTPCRLLRPGSASAPSCPTHRRDLRRSTRSPAGRQGTAPRSSRHRRSSIPSFPSANPGIQRARRRPAPAPGPSRTRVLRPRSARCSPIRSAPSTASQSAAPPIARPIRFPSTPHHESVRATAATRRPRAFPLVATFPARRRPTARALRGRRLASQDFPYWLGGNAWLAGVMARHDFA